ncbi:Type 1 glutamine amidotransferase-like domain-containing protein [Rhodococcoides kyotonense]|uniref:Dipeptidase E n=1 Tax=Rhodococcoides kyotonense TaxID=398843 RepID=A0A239HW54_9NOCA|nr:Type 1 glutamine amidotransferase-like domain-containing protein [Rhodococcus kyotonensis]SNS85308.1 dipeptidase E [Rhodococcus kyotonensis]
MKLFLASYRFGAHAEKFVAMTGTPGRIAVIANAADSWPDAARASAVTSEVRGLRELGFSPEELDLRSGDVESALDSVAAVWVRGGNTFVLRSRLRLSGADEEIARRVRDGRLVYGGYSAGACVASRSLRGIEAADDPNEVRPTTGSDVVWDGLGFVDVALIPHFGSILDDTQTGAVMVDRYSRDGTPYLTLDDDQVLLVDGDRQERL